MCCDRDEILQYEPEIRVEDTEGDELSFPGWRDDVTSREYQVVRVRMEGSGYSRDRLVLVVLPDGKS